MTPPTPDRNNQTVASTEGNCARFCFHVALAAPLPSCLRVCFTHPISCDTMSQKEAHENL
eukprot:1159636-Pelagomonas_calceolata.AAC.3